MTDNKKYYYLKLKDNFFDTDEIIVLESMQDGYLYSNILLKLYLRSLKYDGRLMFNEKIPFNSKMLAQVTRHSVGVIEKAMNIFQKLGLVEVLDNGAIYMSDIQNFIGKSTTEADRIRDYRNKITNERNCTNVQLLYDKSTPEKEREKEKEKDLYIEPAITQFDTTEAFEQFYQAYPRKKSKEDARMKWNDMKITPALFTEIMQGLERAKEEFWQYRDIEFIPYPATWLSTMGWQDETD